MAGGLGIRGTVEAGLLLRQRAVSPCRRLPHVKADALSAHTSDSRPPQDGANGAAESASVAALGRMADNFEDARAAADAAAGEWLEVEAENERLKLLLALALRGWASSLGGSE